MALQASQNIFDIEIELQQLATAFDQLEEGGTEEELTAAVLAYFGEKLDQRDRKLDGYAAVIAQRDAYAKIRKEEAARLAALAKTDENVVKNLKKRLQDWFGFVGMRKTETKFHKFWIQNNGGVRTWEALRESTEADWSDPETSRYVMRTRTIVTKWDPYCQLEEGGPLGAFNVFDQIIYSWNSEEVLKRLLDVEVEAEKQAEEAHKAQYSISLDEGLTVAQCASRADEVANLACVAYWAENGLPFAKLNARGEHLRVK